VPLAAYSLNDDLKNYCLSMDTCPYFYVLQSSNSRCPLLCRNINNVVGLRM